MASGDGSDNESIDSGGPGPAAEPLDAPIRITGTDPVVEAGWLDRRSRHHDRRRPRWSTVALTAAFLAVFILYLLLQPA